MGEFIIEGGRPLRGSLQVQGAKNSVLPILAATILHSGVSVLHHCPRLRDVDASIRILRQLGCRADWEGDDLVVDASTMVCNRIPDHLMREDALLCDLFGGHPQPLRGGGAVPAWRL